MTHIDEARNAASLLAGTDTSHPAYERFALKGILHALLALHDQATPAAPKPTPAKRTTTKKADQ